MKLLRWLFVFCSIAVALGGPSLAEGESGSLKWRGCGISKAAFMEACAEQYAKETGVEIQLSGGGAALGIEAAGTGGADLGGTCRMPQASLNEDRPGLKLAVVAWDALAAVVHPSNEVENITTDHLKQVLQQKITNWKELGGPDARIFVVARRGKISGVGHSTRLLIMGDSDADYGETIVRLNSSGPVEKFVEKTPGAIAITGISSARRRELKLLKIDGHAPTVNEIASGAYPYYRPLYVAFKPGLKSRTDEFVEWLLGDRGQGIIEEQGTVNLAQGASLAKRYEHFGNTSLIVNFEALQARAQVRQ
jgi:phosphate transport system substrate-binding protein